MKYIFFIIVWCILVQKIEAQCTACNTTISVNDNTNRTLNSNNEKICITGGVFTGNITLNGTGNSICIGTNGTIGTGGSITLNGTNSIVDNYGSVTITSLSINNNTVYNNYGTTTITGTLDINSNGITYNQISGTTNVGNFNVNTNANLNISGGIFRQTQAGSTANNNSLGTINITNNASLNIAGNFVNNSTVNSNRGTVNITGNFTNNSGANYNLNNGLLNIGGTMTNNGNITTSGTGCSKMNVTGNITNNGGANIQGTGGARIDVCGSGSTTNFGSITNTQPTTCSCNVALPISLINFLINYDENNNKVNIFWTALSDEDNSYFVVEKSLNGIDFEVVAQKNAIKSIIPQNYSVKDEIVENGYVYYRLKNVESNRFFYSDIKVVTIKNKQIDIVLFPNPTSEYFFMDIKNAKNELISISILDLQGKKVSNFDIMNVNQSNKFDVSFLAKGIYIVEITAFSETNKDIIRKKIVKVE